MTVKSTSHPVYFGCPHHPVCRRRWYCEQRKDLEKLVLQGAVTREAADHLIALWLQDPRTDKDYKEAFQK